MPAHGLVFLDVSWVLALPLYLYVEPWGRYLEEKPTQSRFHPKGKSPSRTPGPDARVPGVWTQTPGSLASGPWTPQNFLLRFLKTLWAFPLAQIKCSHTQTFRKTSGTPSGEFQNPSGDQTLLSHISIFISGPFRSSSSCP